MWISLAHTSNNRLFRLQQRWKVKWLWIVRPPCILILGRIVFFIRVWRQRKCWNRKSVSHWVSIGYETRIYHRQLMLLIYFHSQVFITRCCLQTATSQLSTEWYAISSTYLHHQTNIDISGSSQGSFPTRSFLHAFPPSGEMWVLFFIGRISRKHRVNRIACANVSERQRGRSSQKWTSILTCGLVLGKLALDQVQVLL